MNIDWAAFALVFAVSLGAGVSIVALYSLGIRFLATPARQGGQEEAQPARDDEDDDVDSAGRPFWASAAAYLCFGLGALSVLFGIYLVIPVLHS